mmetsp:Transcript_128901/g.234184  ORF Transcript_128901/g.234184 Transcript_128901/m.234184 type:complete len:496 (+) Transcript_128901:117-1604(+)
MAQRQGPNPWLTVIMVIVLFKNYLPKLWGGEEKTEEKGHATQKEKDGHGRDDHQEAEEDSRFVSSSKNKALRKMGLEEILVLQVERAANRSTLLEKDAKNMGLPLEIFHATDGYSHKGFRERIWPTIYPNSTCTNLIASIFDTHERAWVRAAQNSADTLIVEDDIRLTSDFVKLFVERKRELPADYNMVFIGTALRIHEGALKHSKKVVRPNKAENKFNSPLLGFWGYFVSPKGATRLLKMRRKDRQSGFKSWQPVDLWLSHNSHRLKGVFVFEPPYHLQEYFEKNPDRHHVIESHRQMGIVYIAKNLPSLNTPTQSAEKDEMVKCVQDQVKHGEANRHLKGLRVSQKCLSRMRRYSCWNTANMMSNTGLSMLRILEEGREAEAFPKYTPKPGGVSLANYTLMLAIEALASGIRLHGGTWLEYKGLEEHPAWVKRSLQRRMQNGFAAVAPSDGWSRKFELPFGELLNPDTLKLQQPITKPGPAESYLAELENQEF